VVSLPMEPSLALVSVTALTLVSVNVTIEERELPALTVNLDLLELTVTENALEVTQILAMETENAQWEATIWELALATRAGRELLATRELELLLD